VAGTVLFIGDQYRELTGIRKALLPHFFYRIFDEPKQAERFLLKGYYPRVNNQPWVRSEAFDHTVRTRFHFCEKTLSDELCSSHRFEEVVVAVIDSSIREPSLFDLCRRIQFIECKKLLLILPDEVGMAKKAVKEGIIDGYVVKDDSPSMMLKLTTAISTLAYNYFQEFSLPIVSQLQLTMPYLSDVAFVDFFQNICFDKDIIEFYLIDPAGGYLLLDANANPYYFEIASGQVPTTWSAENINAVCGKQIYYYRLFDEAEMLPLTAGSQEWESFRSFCARAAEYL
jgi:hypothetical protein